jgi:hypothetical protein
VSWELPDIGCLFHMSHAAVSCAEATVPLCVAMQLAVTCTSYGLDGS